MDRVERIRQLLAGGLVFAAASLGLAIAEAQVPMPPAGTAPAAPAPVVPASPAASAGAQGAPQVDSFEVPQNRLADITQELRRRFSVQRGVRLAADERTRRILVVAPAGQMDDVRKAIRELAALPAPATQPLPPIAEPATSLLPRAVADKEIRYAPRDRSRVELLAELAKWLPKRVSGGVAPSGEGRFTLQGPQLQLTELYFAPAAAGVRDEVLLKGPPGIVEGWRDLLIKLDVAPERNAAGDMRLVSLDRADRQQVQTALLALQQGKLAADGTSATVRPRWGCCR